MTNPFGDGAGPAEPFLPPMRPRRGFGANLQLRLPGPRLRRAARWSASGAMVVLAAVWLQNLVDPPPLRNGWLPIVILAFPFVFFPFAVSILVIGSWQQRGFWEVVGSPRPWWSIVWRAAVLAGLVLLAITSSPGGGAGRSGQPIAEQGSYYVNTTASAPRSPRRGTSSCPARGRAGSRPCPCSSPASASW